MTSPRKALLYVIAFVVVVVVAMGLIVRLMLAPVPGDKVTYTAVFNDVSGLYTGNPVRIAGVAVGKVTAIDLDGANARVSFTVASDHQLDQNSQVAVRYQNLIGQRYLEVIRHDGDSARQSPEESIETNRTIPSFDITDLFNGIAPLIGSVDPAEVNRFLGNMVTVLQGDGSGMAPALAALDRISSTVGNRDVLLLGIVDNLNRLAGQIGGRSPQVARLVENLNGSILRLTERIEVVKESLSLGDQVLVPLMDLLDMLQGSYDSNYGPLDAFLRRVVPFTPQVVDVLAAIPGLISAINDGTRNASAATYSCSHGQLDLPVITKVLLGGREVVVCR